jgi:hypothetical protein
MKKLIMIGLILSSQVSFAAPTVKSWINPECATGNCEVKAMRLYVDKWNSTKDQMAGNSMAVEIETSSMSHVKKYAVVQYIQGCLFQTSNLGDIRMASREFFGKQGQPFKHVGWELDSASDKDPIYWSNDTAGFDEMRGFFIPRNSYYQNANSILTESANTWAGKISNLRENKIFASDFPTPSAWEEKNGIVSARIASLNFKICLHKVEDVPESVESPKTNIGAAMTCMEWSSNYQMDFKKKTFVEKTGLHPACL